MRSHQHIQTSCSFTLAALALACTFAHGAAGAIVVTNDSAQWTSQVGSFTTIDFTELAQLEFLTDQYAPLGVTFTGTAVGVFGANAFPTDNQGIMTWTSKLIEAQFGSPLTELAIEFGSLSLWVFLYLGDEFVASTTVFVLPFNGPFVGIVSETPFDRVVMTTPDSTVLIDNIYFGAPVPAPGVLGLLALAGFAGQRRRRRE